MKTTLLFVISLCSIALLPAQEISKTVHVASAGRLYSAVTPGERKTVTHVVISGTIDARDFQILRDSLPKLSVIDLSSATITAYTGIVGNKNNTASYLDNTIPADAFYAFNFNNKNNGNRTLTTIIFPRLVTTIGDNAFRNCTALKQVTLPASLTAIEDNAFAGCTALLAITIPPTLLVMREGAFAGCTALAAIALPPALIYLGNHAFAECTALPSIYIPAAITSLNNAFAGCRCTYDIDANNRTYSSSNGVLFNKRGDTLLQCPSSMHGVYSIPQTVAVVGFRSFFGCKDITAISIPPSVTVISEAAFLDCSGITAVSIPPSVTTIGDYAFANCSAMTTADIAPGVTTIGNAAFSGCSNLTAISIPSSIHAIRFDTFIGCSNAKTLTLPPSVTFIGKDAFAQCTALQSIHCGASIPVVLIPTEGCFSNCNTKKCVLHVPKGSKTAYQNAEGWKDFKNIIEE